MTAISTLRKLKMNFKKQKICCIVSQNLLFSWTVVYLKKIIESMLEKIANSIIYNNAWEVAPQVD